MSNIVKNMNKLSLFLLGLVVAFNVAACGCDKDDKKDGKVEIKQAEEKELTFKATEEIAKIEDATIAAPEFEQDTKAVSASGNTVTGKIEKDKEFKLKLKAKDAAKEGDANIEIKAGGKVVAKLTVKITKK